MTGMFLPLKGREDEQGLWPACQCPRLRGQRSGTRTYRLERTAVRTIKLILTFVYFEIH
jgi:hypothetical protein